ncbi:DUF2723 domain-containing protein [Empedobacter falsenii]|uniref:protein O-mannosyl-transferase family n=1 Tax=Empedobacter falsenii TaxID=343874 RepID=UPI002577EF8E|nr:DUF2723 domain-containing protein [Empedobacter falsenii]MDM1298755.1 DUF2723 domain-containing protein [Empedobacter falsenii]MDM1318635.1 DUF2723 domain-containing protein [Empedobacter falsenii]
MLSKKIVDNSLLIIVLLFFSIVYYFTLYPGVGGRVNFGDSAKFQFLWAIDGVPHSTGYPQYTFITKMFAKHLPFFEPWKKISILSTLFGVATLAVLYKTALSLTKDSFLSLLPVITLGSCYVFWSQSTEPEVYTLNSFYLVSTLFCLINYYNTRKNTYLYLSIFIYAISFGNHLMMITLLPAFVYLICVVDKKVFFQPKFLLVTLVSVLIGISQYYYLWYLTHQESIGLEYVGYNPTFNHFVDYVTGGQFRDQLNNNPGFYYIFSESLSIMLTQIWKNIGWSILIILIICFFSKRYNTKSNHQIKFFLLIALLCHIIFTSRYDIGDIVVYYIPIFIYILLFFLIYLNSIISKKTKIIIIVLHILLGFILINQTNKKLDQISLNPMNELEIYANSIPDNSTLFLPHAPFYDYYGAMAVNYMKFVDNPKSLNILQALDSNQLPKEFYIPVKYAQEIPQDLYQLNYVDLQKEENIVDFINSNKSKTIIISVKDEAVNGLNDNDKLGLKKIGLNKIEKLQIRGSYLAVISNNKVIAEEYDNFDVVKIIDIDLPYDKHLNKLTSAGYSSGNYSNIIIDNKDYSMNQKGLNIVVIDEKGIYANYSDTNISNLIHPFMYKMTLK